MYDYRVTPGVDGRSDIYALGCVAFWLLAGRHVFEAATPLEMLMKHVGETPAPVSPHAEQEIPPEVDTLLLACMEKDRDSCIGSAEELNARLVAIQDAYPWSAAGARRSWAAHVPDPVLTATALADEQHPPGCLQMGGRVGRLNRGF